LTFVRLSCTVLTVSGITNIDRRTARRQETRAEIVEAAWELVREHGLAGLSLRDLGRRVNMRAQSLYSYFASKNDIYDAMFMEGYRAFTDGLARAASTESMHADPVTTAKETVRAFVEFCTTDPVRYQLLFQRTIPGFEPSAASWAVALDAYEQTRERLAEVGVHDQATFDLWTAVMTGLTDQQISNDPGGTRWAQLVDRAVDMLLLDITTHTDNESEQS
jgi:AcrR family transcriptional regulator